MLQYPDFRVKNLEIFSNIYKSMWGFNIEYFLEDGLTNLLLHTIQGFDGMLIAVHTSYFG